MSTDDAYNAGFFDGEGCISLTAIKASPGAHQLRIYVGQVDRRPLDRLAEAYGGTVIERPAVGGYRPLFMWQPASVAAERALRAMLPHLIVKRGQAEAALACRDLLRSRGGRKLTGQEIQERQEAFEKFRKTK